MPDATAAVRVGRWRIDITVRDAVELPIPRARLARAMARAAEAGGATAPASIALILTDDAELADLNAAHLGESGPTDVLSFPMTPSESRFPGPPGRMPHLGDVAVSVERAIAQAHEGRGGQTGDVRWSAADELLLLVTHGTLHLCGMDHAEPADEAAMRALEKQLLDA
ncbi:MAG: rRNA maturation RNase YbeY [Chloroflexi bacterium]|nr:rRNA maturation RNase YbeY [Chloroflexota bacterium]